ncbi:MAG: acyl-CoA dehydrogenase family protein [Deltaproteobacteria bacterium]|nr:acyl-CoA dehydrogenase family protein [Deltaproteobacteria bacterium]MBW2393126.1 acyl-CoA dehydrogenase family protein [Deltaproteobacteria bacterium]
MAEPDFYLSEEQRELQRALREFVGKEIAPIAAACDAEERYPLEIFSKLGGLGYLGLRFPEDVGGSGGTCLDYAILCEELAFGSAGIALGIYVHMALACAALEAFGTETMKETWLPPALRGEKIGAWAFAEAGAGSDAGSIATRAVADGDDFVLNGSKLFITNGPIADFLIVVASTEPEQRLKGLSLFLVERDRPGFKVAGSLSKLGVRASEMAELVFEDCRVPRENLIGRENRGFLDSLRTLTLGRIASAAFATGVARAAFEATLDYAGKRKQFGQPIGSFQAVRFGIADMAVQIEASRLLCHRAAIAADQGLPHGREANMAKLFATEACTKIVERALHFHGAAGFMSESPIQRFYRDCKVFELGEGSSELQRDMIAREIGL